MAKYRISGVWKDDNGTITHYAFHRVLSDGVTRATKTLKAEAVKLLDGTENSAETRVWNYKAAKWNIGEKVEVVKGSSGKYLRSDPDNSLTDNLGHLIDYDWILP